LAALASGCRELERATRSTAATLENATLLTVRARLTVPFPCQLSQTVDLASRL
jgi:hypothetical protein